MDTAGLLGPKYEWRQAAWSAVPAHLRPGLVRYVDDGVPTGAGLRGLIANGQVFDVLKQLDDMTRLYALDIMKFLYSEAPSACWGSEEAVRRWEALGGYRNHATVRRTITTTIRTLYKDVEVQFERRGRNVFVHPSGLTEAGRAWAQTQIAARDVTDD